MFKKHIHEDGPTNYQQWIKIFEEIKQNNTLKDNYSRLIRGKLKDKKYSIDYFNKELIDFVKFYLKFIFENYQVSLNYFLKKNDYSSVRYLTINFIENVKMIRFFDLLNFVNSKLKFDLDSEIQRNVTEFNSKFEKYLYENSGYNPFFNELNYIINCRKEEINVLL